ncbi:MAG: hypothetical protein IAG10_30410 [Planctomycetaceae bacterium]|nr:hypothetical protein [Planctomycetaceae bacterium]
MPESVPPPISPQEQRSRLLRIRRLAKKLGFEGQVEYRHVVSHAGGAQYGIGSTANQDLLVVFADAFDRDADPNDFSLEAILAHERGHQLVVRHSKLAAFFARGAALASEEILASLIGSIIVEQEKDQQNLYYKAMYEAVTQGMTHTHAVRLLHDLRLLLEKAR